MFSHRKKFPTLILLKPEKGALKKNPKNLKIEFWNVSLLHLIRVSFFHELVDFHKFPLQKFKKKIEKIFSVGKTKYEKY